MKNYNPIMTHPVVLVAIFLVTALLIAPIEYACQNLPDPRDTSSDDGSSAVTTAAERSNESRYYFYPGSCCCYLHTLMCRPCRVCPPAMFTNESTAGIDPVQASKRTPAPMDDSLIGNRLRQRTLPPLTPPIVSKGQYFIATYLPTITAVFYRMIWTSVYAAIKLMEPFRQLARPSGADAASALHSFYLSSNLSLVSLRNLFSGHLAILLASLIHVIAGVMGSLAAETLLIDIHYGFSVNRRASRALEAFLGLTAILILGITWIQHTRSSGVNANPSSIAAIASLQYEPEVLELFQNLESEATNRQLRRKVCGKFKLASSPTSGTIRTKLLRIETSEELKLNLAYGRSLDSCSTAKRTPPIFYKNKLRASPETLRDIGFILFMLGVLVVVLAYYLDYGDSRFNLFMTSDTAGPRLVMTLFGIIINSHWKRIERGKLTHITSISHSFGFRTNC